MAVGSSAGGELGTEHANARIGIASDHGGYELKTFLMELMRKNGYEVIDFGDHVPRSDDDYPDFIIPLARAVACGQVQRGISICGSGIGSAIVANKIAGVRASVIHDCFSAHQGVEDDHVNMICLGGLVIGHALAWQVIRSYLAAQFNQSERHCRRLAKVAELELKAQSWLPCADRKAGIWTKRPAIAAE
jgi:ribose 5-phosphate isomerase B